MSTMNVHLTTASASPILHAKGGIYGRTDASDDEFEVYRKAAEILREMEVMQIHQMHEFHSQGWESFNAPAVASKRHLSQIDNPLEQSDEESIQIRRKDSHSRKRRRVSPESEETAKLKTTGLDLADASSAFTKGNAASPSELKDHDDESATQMNDRGNYYSQTKIKEQNRKLIRETAKFLEDPLQDIEDYEEWLKNVIKAPEEMKKKYDTKMKAKLILHFYKRKIQNKTGILPKKILWYKLPQEDTIRWDENDKVKSVLNLGQNYINEILGRLDQLHLSEEFLRNIKQPEIKTGLAKK